MQNAPSYFNQIYEEGDFDVEYKVDIGGTEYDQDNIWQINTSRRLFSENTPMIGCAMVGQIDLQVNNIGAVTPRAARIRPYIRLRSRVNNRVSGWVQKGEFFVDTRPADDTDGIYTIDIQGFDALRKANQKYPSSTLYWSNTSPNAYSVVNEIAGFIGVTIDPDTVTRLRNTPYIIAFPAQYTMAEVLGSIAAMYGGNFIISDTGKLLLVGLMDLPEETHYLVSEDGDCITFGTGANETIILTC